MEKQKELEYLLTNMNIENLEKLYESTRVFIFNFALTIVKNKTEAEDVLSETIINIYEKAHTYKQKGKPMAWILKITKNNSLMKLRKNKHLTTITEEEWNKITIETSLTKEEKILLEETLLKLNEKEKKIIILHAISGLKHKEIASLLKIPLGSVLSNYNRALKKLKNLLE